MEKIEAIQTFDIFHSVCFFYFTSEKTCAMHVNRIEHFSYGLFSYDHEARTGPFSYDHVARTGPFSYDHVALTGPFSYDKMARTGSFSYDYVARTGPFSYDHVARTGPFNHVARTIGKSSIPTLKIKR